MISEPEDSAEDRAVLEALGKLPSIEPPDDQRMRFRQRADTAQTVMTPTRRWVPWALAASVMLVVGGGWLIDHHIQRIEVVQARTELTIALKDLSAATRLQAVRTAGVSSVRDQGIVEALTQALLTDPSTNVRVAAAEALGHVAGASAFGSAASRSLAQDVSPFVQAALLNAVTHFDIAARRRFVTALLARPDLSPVLRAKAQASFGS